MAVHLGTCPNETELVLLRLLVVLDDQTANFERCMHILVTDILVLQVIIRLVYMPRKYIFV